MKKEPPNMWPECSKYNSIKPMRERTGGFSVGKAILGAFLLEPLDAAVGALDKKKVTYQCTNYGYTIEI